MKYYLHDGDEQCGPFSLDDLKTKSITKETPVWRKGLNDWAKAGTLDELSSLFASVPPLFKKQSLPVKSNQRIARVPIAVFVIVGLLAWLTNPGIEQHKQAASGKLNEQIEQLRAELKPKKKFFKVLKDIGFALSSGVLQQQIEQRVWTDNYHLCSLTKVRLKNRDVTVGFGAFGNVWLFTDMVSGISPEELID